MAIEPPAPLYGSYDMASMTGEPGHLQEALINAGLHHMKDEKFACPTCNRQRHAFEMVDVREDGRWPFGFICSNCHKTARRMLRHICEHITL